MSTVNLFSDDWDDQRTRPGYTWGRRGLRRPLGIELLGASLYELPPGQATFPLHWHWANEELLIVVAGEVALRTPDGESELIAGDVVGFARGPAGGHQVRNRGDKAARVLIVSTMLHPDVAEYPDSGKIIAAAGGPLAPGEDPPLELALRKDDAVGYWDGEPTPTSGATTRIANEQRHGSTEV